MSVAPWIKEGSSSPEKRKNPEMSSCLDIKKQFFEEGKTYTIILAPKSKHEFTKRKWFVCNENSSPSQKTGRNLQPRSRNHTN